MPSIRRARAQECQPERAQHPQLEHRRVLNMAKSGPP
jgi:hypothetical protein